MTDDTKSKQVALVGMAKTHRHLAPFDDPDVEIWTINESLADRPDFKDKDGNHYIKRTTRHFQLHPYWNAMRPMNNNDPHHPEWLRQEHDFPIYMQDHFDDIPSSVKYPYDEVFGKFPAWAEYATSTFPYMLALALYEGFDIIHIYGFDMASQTEYGYQKAATEFWIGVATGMGVELRFPDQCKLLRLSGEPEMYAYGMVVDVNVMRLEMERDRVKNNERQAEMKLTVLRGEQGVLMRALSQPDLPPEQAQNLSGQLMRVEQQMIKLHGEVSFYSGAAQAFQKVWADKSGQMPPKLVIPHYAILPDGTNTEMTQANAKRALKKDQPKPPTNRRRRKKKAKKK